MTTDSSHSQPITLTTVTPIWTGGADGTADRLHATGIMGSLRWWYEVLVRGVGGEACDPSKHSCLYDPKKSDDGLCHVCRVFGATGWSRRFRMVVSDEKNLQSVHPWKTRIKADRPDYIDSNGTVQTPKGWFFNNPPLSGSTSIEIIPTGPLYISAPGDSTPVEFFRSEIIRGLIQFMADWGSIGAKPQMGFGVVELIHHQGTQELLHHLKGLTGDKTDKSLPSLQNMFFTSVNADSFPAKTFSTNETFNLKYDLRRLFATNDSLRHFVMGEAPQEGEHQGAKIMISRPYKEDKIIRLWGWVPEEVTKFGVSREQVIQQINTHLRKYYTIDYWREFASDRDNHRYNEIIQFLESLFRWEK